MASGSGNMHIMLAIHAKRTMSIDMYRPLRQFIVSTYGEREAQDAEEDLQAVQQMRADVERQADALEARRDLLQRYFRALSVIEARFPIGPEREQINQLHFQWFDAFKQARKASQQSIHFEKAAIVFNLAATQSQLGLAAERASPLGLKQACNCFQASAGAFAFLRDNLSMKAGGGGGPGGATLDVGVECAGMLERLMLAQAQECFYEKVIADAKPSVLCGRVAQQVAIFYEEAHAALLLPPLNQHFDRAWVSHVQLKAMQYQADAYYLTALDLHEKELIGEEIARLKAAQALLGDAKKSGRGVAAAPLLDACTKLEGMVARNLERAVKENDRVYLMRVPANDALPRVAPASLVQATAQGPVLDAGELRMFHALVPDSSAKALSKYTSMVDDVIRAQAEKLQHASDVARVRLREMDLPDALLALDGAPAFPEALRDDIEACQVDGGPAGLEGEMAQLRDLRRVNEELLVQAEEQLQEEARDDAAIREQFGTRWTRPQSATLTKNLHDRATAFALNLRQAADSDARIERSVRENEPRLAVLKAQPVESLLPKLSKPLMSVHGNEDGIAQRLRALLGELEALGSQRAGLEDMLKDMKRRENILPRLMNQTSGAHDDLFRAELAKYDPVCAQVAKNVEAQEQLLQQIRAQSDAFAAAFNLQDYKASKARVEAQVAAAVAKYREIRENMNDGLKFYITLQDAITSLKQQCGDYVMTRSIQRREMLDDVQRQLAGLSFGDSQRGAYTSGVGSNQQPPQPQQQQGGNPNLLAQVGQHFSNLLFQRGGPPQQDQQFPSTAAPSSQYPGPPHYAPNHQNPAYAQNPQASYPPHPSSYTMPPGAPLGSQRGGGDYSAPVASPFGQQQQQWNLPPYAQGSPGMLQSQMPYASHRSDYPPRGGT